jgi:hypothetical protein
MVAAGAAALALAAGAAGNGGTSHELAVKSCTSLQTSLGEKTFAMTFGTTRHTSAFAACVTQMERTESAAQRSAQTTCSGKKGKAFHQCVQQQTRLQLAARVTTLKNAATTCRTQLRSMGVSSFVSTFGANHNLANAFGKCVSRTMHGATTTQPTTTTTAAPAPTVSTFHVTLNALNGTGARGSALLRLSGNQLKVEVTLAGLQPKQAHPLFIGGISSGSAACPSPTADTSKDGVVSLGEGQPLFGSTVLDLTPAPTASRHGTISFVRVYTVDPSKLTPLTSRTLVVQGMTVGTTYDQTVPVACGVIST